MNNTVGLFTAWLSVSRIQWHWAVACLKCGSQLWTPLCCELPTLSISRYSLVFLPHIFFLCPFLLLQLPFFMNSHHLPFHLFIYETSHLRERWRWAYQYIVKTFFTGNIKMQFKMGIIKLIHSNSSHLFHSLLQPNSLLQKLDVQDLLPCEALFCHTDSFNDKRWKRKTQKL